MNELHRGPTTSHGRQVSAHFCWRLCAGVCCVSPFALFSMHFFFLQTAQGRMGPPGLERGPVSLAAVPFPAGAVSPEPPRTLSLSRHSNRESMLSRFCSVLGDPKQLRSISCCRCLHSFPPGFFSPFLTLHNSPELSCRAGMWAQGHWRRWGSGQMESPWL